MATIIRATGEELTVRPANGRTFSLLELYQHTGCDMVQQVTLADGRLMWMDEEAYLRDPQPPPNAKATRLYAEAGGVRDWTVLGDVLVTEPDEVD